MVAEFAPWGHNGVVNGQFLTLKNTKPLTTVEHGFVSRGAE